MHIKSPLFLALDVSSEKEALKLLDETHEYIGAVKVGSQLFLNEGPQIVKKLSALKPVFLDLKHFDIPHTVRQAVEAAYNMGAHWVSVHALNGKSCMKELQDLFQELKLQDNFHVLWVTVLTSFSDDEKNPLPLNSKKIHENVLLLADLAHSYGFSNFVCSGLEVQALRERFKNGFLLTPAVRLKEDKKDDQIRILSPQEALQQGASAVVVGRAIYKSPDPKQAAKKYYEALCH